MQPRLTDDERQRVLGAIARARALHAAGDLAPGLEDLLLIEKLLLETAERADIAGADGLLRLPGEPLSSTVMSDRRLRS